MTSPDAPTTLAHIADFFLCVYDDLFDPEEELDLTHDADVREVLRRNYLHGDCQAFAVALHDRLGWPIVGINGGLHVAVQDPHGRVVDYAGVRTPAQLAKAYGAATIAPWTRQQAVDSVCPGEEDPADPWDPIRLAKQVMDLERRWHPSSPSPARRHRSP